MLQDAGLSLEFWPEAGEADVYVRNRVATGPVVNGETTCLMEAWTSVKPSIDHLRVWGCKCYSSIDTRSLPNEARIDKLVNTERPDVFMNYDENTTIQYQIWAPDRQAVIKHHKVTFSENERWESEPLNLKVITVNVLPERRPVDRPRKVADAPAQAVVSSDPVVAVSKPVVIEIEIAPIDASSYRALTMKEQNDGINPEDDYVDEANDTPEVNEMIAESTIQTRAKLAALIAPPRQV